MQTRLRLTALALVLCGACTSSSPERAPSVSVAAVTLPDVPPAPEAPVSQADLNTVCTMVTEILADRSIPLRVRMRQSEEQLEEDQPERHRRLDSFLDDALGHREHPPAAYAAVQAAAREHSLTFECPNFERVLTLRAGNELDLDDAGMLRFDMDALCHILGSGDRSQPAIAVQMAERIEADITDLGLRQAWQALQNADPSNRHAMLQRFGQENGVSAWQCPALDAPSVP